MLWCSNLLQRTSLSSQALSTFSLFIFISRTVSCSFERICSALWLCEPLLRISPSLIGELMNNWLTDKMDSLSMRILGDDELFINALWIHGLWIDGLMIDIFIFNELKIVHWWMGEGNWWLWKERVTSFDNLTINISYCDDYVAIRLLEATWRVCSA